MRSLVSWLGSFLFRSVPETLDSVTMPIKTDGFGQRRPSDLDIVRAI